MALIILLISILLLVLLINYHNQKDFISPTFLMLVSFLMASVLIAMNYENWSIQINSMLLVCVLVAVFAWVMGSMLYRLKNKSITFKPKDSYQNEMKLKYIKRYPVKTLHIVSFFLTMIFLVMLLKSVDLSGGFTTILSNLYQEKATSTSGNFLLHQIDKIIITIAYISIYQLLSCMFLEKTSFKYKLNLILPIIYALICTLLSSDRNVFLRFCIYFLCLWILFFKNRTTTTRRTTNRKILKYAIVILIFMILSFYVMGKMKQYTSNFERMIGIYGGSGLYNFNLYLGKFNGSYTYGRSTFNEFLGVFARFGIINEKNLVPPVGFISYASPNGYVYSSNIYSGLQPFYADFGLFGIFLFCFTLGIFFEFLYQKTEKKRFGFHWIFYATFIYPTIYISIAEQAFSRMHLGLVYELFWLLFFYIIIYDRKKIFGKEFYLFTSHRES